MSSDGGALLRAVDRRVGLTRRLAACFADHRNPSFCEHSLQRLLAQRLFGLALAYEDINNHDRLREDILLVELFLDSYAEAPEEIVLDVDVTDDPLNGRQEGRFFHGYYDCYCFLPIYVTSGAGGCGRRIGMRRTERWRRSSGSRGRCGSAGHSCGGLGISIPRLGKGYPTKGELSHPFARLVSRWLAHCRTRATTFVSQTLDERSG